MKKKKVFGTREWADSAVNVLTGCKHDCLYCVDGDTLILMASGLTKKIKNLEIGDKIYGVMPDKKRHKLVESIVLKKWTSTKPSYKITLINGIELICSGDHKWLSASRSQWKHTVGAMAGKNRRPYLTINSRMHGLGVSINTNAFTETDAYKRGYLSGIIKGDGTLKKYDYSNKRRNKDIVFSFRLTLKDEAAVLRAKQYLTDFNIDTNDMLFKMKDRKGIQQDQLGIRTSKEENFNKIISITAFEDTNEFKRGFLAGIYDAEGSSEPLIKRIFNSDDAIVEFTTKSLDFFNFKYTFDKEVKTVNCIVKTIRILGGISEFLRFYQITQPAINKKFNFFGVSLKNVNKGQRIASIEKHKDDQVLYDITTTTENFIANGMVSHNCYAKTNAIKYKLIASVDDWKHEKAKENALGFYLKKYKHQVMFPSTHDITPENLDLCFAAIVKILNSGNKILIVSKPSLICIKKICTLEESVEQILFRFSIGSSNPEILSFWEPNAPSLQERLACLKYAFEAGFATSVSCEPMLDNNVEQLVELVSPFVTDSIWIGKMNFSISRLKANGHDNVETMNKANELEHFGRNERIFELYEKFKNNPKVKWKESFKKVLGLDEAEEGSDK